MFVLCISCPRFNTPAYQYYPFFHYLFVDLADNVNTVICLGDNIDVMSKSSNVAKYLRQLLQDNNASQLIKRANKGDEELGHNN